MHPGEHHLSAFAIQSGAHVRQHLGDIPAATGAARQSGRAERAAVVAAVLDFNKSPRAQARPRHRLAGDWLQVKGLKGQVEQVGYQLVFVCVGNHPADVRQGSSGIRVESRPAAGDGDLARSCAGYLADLMARIGSRRLGNGAGIDHHQVGLLGGGYQGVTGGMELPGIGLDLALVQPAADGI